MSRRRKTFSYYSYDRVLSYGAAINMIMGARGLGKTYGAKRLAIRNAVNRGEKFIYLRRYNTELKQISTFFDDIQREFPGFEFSIQGRKAVKRVKGDRKWQEIGYFLALSTAGNVKSVPFPDVTTILFDEFIIETGTTRYLPDEVTRFLDFYSTVDRYQDKTRVLMMSNSVSIMNPYFAQWGIMPGKHEIQRFGEGFIVAHFVDSDRFAKEIANTRFGKFILKHDSRYAEYAVGNEFRDNDGRLVCKKSGDARYKYTIRCEAGSFSVWEAVHAVFIQRRRPRADEILYTITDDVRPGEIGLVTSDFMIRWLRAQYRRGRCFFDSAASRNSFQELFL